MNKFRALILLSALLFPVLCLSQDMETDSLGVCIQQLSAECPVDDGDGWVINSVIATGDTIAIEMTAPASLNSFLSMLMGDGLNVKRLWLNELSHCGKEWKQLFRLMSQHGRNLLFTIGAQGGRKKYSLVMTPQEIGTILAKDKNSGVDAP